MNFAIIYDLEGEVVLVDKKEVLASEGCNYFSDDNDLVYDSK
jgi:hypothetical protein